MQQSAFGNMFIVVEFVQKRVSSNVLSFAWLNYVGVEITHRRCMGIFQSHTLLREPKILQSAGKNQSGNLCSTRNKMCTISGKTSHINPFVDLFVSLGQFVKYQFDFLVS